MRRRSVLLVTVVVAVFGLATQVLPSVAAPSAATTGFGSRPQAVIVVLKRQEPGLPATPALGSARIAAVARDQQTVVPQLYRSGARKVHAFTVIDAVSAVVSPAEIARLKSNPGVSEVVPDGVIRARTAPAGPRASSAASAPPTTPVPGSCLAPGKFQLNPEALQTMRVKTGPPDRNTARSLGFDGHGVKVAFIADGVDTNNPDFIRRNGQHVFVDYKDFTGQGTGVPTGGSEAFGDASAIAAQGRVGYDVSHLGAPLNRECDIKIEGVAPGVSMVALDIFGAENAAFTSQELQAVDYAVTRDHVQVLNESVGSQYFPDDPANLDLLKRANDAAVAAGVTVTASAGDAGPTNTTDTPASDPNVIALGASTTNRLDTQIGYGFRRGDVSGWVNDNISPFSSSGFTQTGRLDDLVAPGDNNPAVCTGGKQYSECTNAAGAPFIIEFFNGTSQAAPETAGVAALVIQAYRKTHGAATPSPALIKQLILSTADDIGAPAEQQGSGRVNAYKAVLAAESYRAARPVGATLLLGAGQLRLVAEPATSHAFSDTVTNNGSGTEVISVSSRTLGAYRRIKSATVRLTDHGPQFVNEGGGTENLRTVRFSVPPGRARLNVALAYASSLRVSQSVELALIDPHHRLVSVGSTSVPSSYNDAQATNPVPGVWTAEVYSLASARGGTLGTVHFAASVARYGSFGTVTPSALTLAPHQTRRIRLRVMTPAVPGDQAGSIVLRGIRPAALGTTTVPVSLRSLIPDRRSVFQGITTGGNGRTTPGVIGAIFYYQWRVAPGRPELNASVRVASRSGTRFHLFLVDPSGDSPAQSSSQTRAPGATRYHDSPASQLHVLSPSSGTWTLIVNFAQVPGDAVEHPFTVTTDYARVPASARGLPNSRRSGLLAGRTYRYAVHVTNTGPSTAHFFLDARSINPVTLRIPGFPGSTADEPFTNASPNPNFLVPTHTSSWFATAATNGSVPIQFDMRTVGGDPDLASSVGTFATASYSASPVTPGYWSLLPQQVGPFGTGPAPKASAVAGMLVRTRGFDPAVHSPTGDLWLTGGHPRYSPRSGRPGSATTVPFTITPSAPRGTVVRGTLFVDDNNFVLGVDAGGPNDTGNEVAAIPYEYTVR